LKWSGYEYRGKLISADGYMNLQLDQTEEYISGKPAGQLGQVLIRYVDLWSCRFGADMLML
jgi:small nuclear ribonucleoprotein F